MRKTLIVVLVFLMNSLGILLGQITPSPSGNYNTDRAFWTSYYDSIIEYNYDNGINVKIPGYSRFLRERDYWDLFVPSSGSYVDALKIIELNTNHLKTSHFNSYSTSQSNSLTSTTVDWKELGPKNMSKIKTKHNQEWVDTHMNNNGENPQYDFNNAEVKSGAHTAKIDRLFQHPTNPSELFACAGGNENGGGGLFYSDNNGESWVILGTDQIPFATIIAFGIKPSSVQPNAGSEFLFVGLSSGAVYRSDDFGINWYECNYNGNNLYPFWSPTNLTPNSLPYDPVVQNYSINQLEKITDIKFTKKNQSSTSFSRIIVSRNEGVYFSDNFYDAITPNGNYLNNEIIWSCMTDGNGNNFTSIKNDIPIYNLATSSREFHFTDFESFDINGTTNYVLHFQVQEKDGTETPLGNVRHYVVTSSDFGTNWSFLGGINSMHSPNGEEADNKFRPANIEVLANSPNYLYVAGTTTLGSVQNSYMLKRFNFNTSVWEDFSVHSGFNNNGMTTQAHGFAIDPSNEENWWFFTNSIHYMKSGTLSSPPYLYSSYHHADARDVLVTPQGKLFVGTDGGVYSSIIGSDDYILNSSSEGINASQSYRVGLAQQPPFYVASGFWHSGIQVYNPEIDEWHYGVLQDGTFGDVFFLNNERYSLGNQTYTFKVVKDFNNLSTYYAGGIVAPSENISGRSYGIVRNSGNGTDELSFNNNDFDTGLIQLGLTYPIFSASPQIIPNEPDKVTVKTYNNSPLINIYEGCNSNTPSPNLIESIDVQSVYTSLGGNGQANLGAYEFDARANGKFWLILKQDPVWGNFKGARIAEYDPVTGFSDLSFPISDDHNNSNFFPYWLSITDIKQDRQTGILYIGTTNGVYYLDRENSIWKKFSSNVPLFKTSLGIRHCTGELFVSSTNRGIWYTDLIRNESVQTQTWKIENHQTWKERRNLFCTLIIESGASLIIKDELIVFGDQKIIVKPGGHLIIDGGLITSQCGTMWQGIEVWGDNSAPQQSQYQGTLVLNNGATIENANEAVQVWNPNQWNSTGGIVRATNANFINNRRDVSFMPYQAFNGQTPVPNTSFFTECTFKTDNNFLKEKVAPHVTLFGVDDIVFTACTFEDERVVDIARKSKGIHALDAKFRVLGKYLQSQPAQVDYFSNTYYQPSEFNNLTHGIWAASSNAQRNVLVDQSLFIDCAIGVELSQSDNAIISRNMFDRTANSDWFGYQFDVYTNKSSAYFIEGNVMTSQITNNPSIGVTVKNSGLQDNEVRKNKMSSVDYAVYSYGKNRNDLPDFDDYRGLEFLCNQFIDSRVDDELYLGEGVLDGVKLKQGIEEFPAGNEFSTTTGAVDYHLSSSLIEETKYYFYNQSTNAVQEPTLITTPTITKIGTDFNNACETHFDIITPGSGPILDDEIHGAHLRANWNTLLSEKSLLLEELAGLTKVEDIQRKREELALVNRSLNRTANLLIKAALLDSNGTAQEGFTTWTTNRGDALLHSQLADFNFSFGDKTTTQEALNTISEFYQELPENELRKELEDYHSFKTAMLNASNEQGVLEGLDSTTEAIARNHAQHSSGLAQVQAQNLLCFFLNECQSAPAPLIGSSRIGSSAPITDQLNELEESEELALYPNPSRDEVTVSLETTALPLTIRVLDPEGKQVLEVHTDQSQTILNVSGLPKGIYYVLVMDQDEQQHVRKLIKH